VQDERDDTEPDRELLFECLRRQCHAIINAVDGEVAIRSMRERLESHAAGFAQLEEATRHWR
jgi:hypothetical protein